jgi:hypothetical protein
VYPPCSGPVRLSRRQLLQAGAIGLWGLGLPDILRAGSGKAFVPPTATIFPLRFRDVGPQLERLAKTPLGFIFSIPRRHCSGIVGVSANSPKKTRWTTTVKDVLVSNTVLIPIAPSATVSSG